jgi:CTP synthase
LYNYIHHFDRQENLRLDVSIALVGKYTQLSDAYASVIKALDHAAMACQRRLRLVCIEAEDLEDSAKTERPVKYHEAWQNVCKSQ